MGDRHATDFCIYSYVETAVAVTLLLIVANLVDHDESHCSPTPLKVECVDNQKWSLHPP